VFSQDPTAYRSVHPALSTPFHAGKPAVLTVETTERLASQHPLMSPTQHQGWCRFWLLLRRSLRSEADAP
jgi:hypothetical protein